MSSFVGHLTFRLLRVKNNNITLILYCHFKNLTCLHSDAIYLRDNGIFIKFHGHPVFGSAVKIYKLPAHTRTESVSQIIFRNWVIVSMLKKPHTVYLSIFTSRVIATIKAFTQRVQERMAEPIASTIRVACPAYNILWCNLICLSQIYITCRQQPPLNIRNVEPSHVLRIPYKLQNAFNKTIYTWL